jgi:hypothetical protein
MVLNLEILKNINLLEREFLKRKLSKKHGI